MFLLGASSIRHAHFPVEIYCVARYQCGGNRHSGEESMKRIIKILCVVAVFMITQTAQAAVINYKLSGVMPPNGDIKGFEISPDGQYVVYVADQQTDQAFELYSVHISGNSPPLRLSGLLPSGSSIHSFKISPDSNRVVYTAEQDTLGVVELYSVPIGGGTVIKLNGELVSSGNVHGEFHISQDGIWVVYRADMETDDVFDVMASLFE